MKTWKPTFSTTPALQFMTAFQPCRMPSHRFPCWQQMQSQEQVLKGSRSTPRDRASRLEGTGPKTQLISDSNHIGFHGAIPGWCREYNTVHKALSLQAGQCLTYIRCNIIERFNPDRQTHRIFPDSEYCPSLRGKIQHGGQIGDADQGLG